MNLSSKLKKLLEEFNIDFIWLQRRGLFGANLAIRKDEKYYIIKENCNEKVKSCEERDLHLLNKFRNHIIYKWTYLAMTKNLFINGIYRHYKGGLYEILHIGKNADSESFEDVVIYKNKEGQIWVRSCKVFLESIIYKGKEIPRFELIQQN